jgi:effector-binding domain-containing protein
MFRAAALSIAALLFLTGRAAAIEEPKFKLVRQYADFEVRDYPAYTVAETTVSGGFEDAGNEGFHRLFGYISGKNTGHSSIAMTAPVIQAGQKIEMTASVLQSAGGGSFIIKFVMPAASTVQTLPVPNDKRVVIREEPPARFAAIRYTGFWSEENYRTHLKALKAAIAREHLVITGEPVWARYDPPFMPWFFRRNEILIPVSE